jgi:hypothetical protein
MTRRIASMTLGELARTFNDATVRRFAADEKSVFAVLEEVERRGRSARDEFTGAVLRDLPYAHRPDLLRRGGGNVVHGVLLSAFSPTFRRIDLAMAQLLYDGTTANEPGYRHVALTTLWRFGHSVATSLKWGAAVAAGIYLGPARSAMLAAEVVYEEHAAGQGDPEGEVVAMKAAFFLNRGDHRRAREILEGASITPEMMRRLIPLVARYDFRGASHLVSEWVKHPDLDDESRAAGRALLDAIRHPPSPSVLDPRSP